MSQPIQCATCAHYKGQLKCKAFPEGIPEEILTGRFDHTKFFPGDKGVRWKQVHARKKAPK